MAKTANQKLVKALDELWGLCVRERAGHMCQFIHPRTGEKCGRAGNQPHHIFRRGKFSTRWDVTNGVCLCLYHHKEVAHKDYELFRDFVVPFLGEDVFNHLKLVYNAAGKSDIDKDAKLSELRSLLLSFKD